MTKSLISLVTFLTCTCISQKIFAQIEFTEHTFAANYGNAVSVFAIDLDGDGDTDVVSGGRVAEAISWWENDGEQVFTGHTIQVDYVAPFGIHAADLDGDDDIDVLASASGANDDISWWENDGDEEFTRHILNTDLDGAQYVKAADIDSDDDLDVIGAAFNADEILWWENEGDQTFTEHTISDEFDGACSVCAADVDGDGDTDIIASNRIADDVAWFENDGDEDFTENTISDNFDNALEVFACDVDGDGDIDVLGAASQANDITWWENDELDFIEHTIADNFLGVKSIYAADMDLDGDIDVVGGANTGDEVAWWENDGDQDFTEHTISALFNGVRWIHVEDIDSDGDLDVVGAAVATTNLVWWENDLDPVPDATLAGTVSDGETEDPVEDAVVRAGAARDTTDANGNYFIEGVLSGERTVVVTHTDYSRHIEEIEIQEGENTLDVELFPLSTVSGTVTDVDTNDPIEGASLRFGNDDTTTDENGDWEVPLQNQGAHSVSITADHYYVYREVVDVEPGENTFDFEMIPLATITGYITDSETETGVEGSDIYLGDSSYFAVSDDSGYYFIEDIEAGEYDVNIFTEGYFDVEEDDVEVEERENEINFAIDILSGDLTGIVSDALTEELLFGVTVTVIDTGTGDIYREVLTDEDGEYTAETLHDGVRYMVFAELEGYARSDTEEVLIRWDDDNEQDFELTPIFERGIAQLQTEQELETWVSTTGIVTQGTNITDTEHTSIYIQDDSGWGIQVWGDDAWDPENNINRGDEIDVTGFLVEVDEITRITSFELEVTGNNNPMPDPLEESTGDMSQLNLREGTWGQISGQINRDPPGEGDYSLIVDDGSGQCEVRIVETTAIDLTNMVMGDWGIFTGVISLSRQGLRIIPNMQEDVSHIAIDPPTDLTSDQEVIQGDTLQLEVTLTWEHDHLDDWLRFKIYRDEEHIGNTQEMTWSEIHIDPNPGEYETYTWIYTVTAVYDEGDSEHSNEAEVIWNNTSVIEGPWSGIPTEWALEAVYPNPFNPELTVIVALPQQSKLDVRIFNILGEQVALLVNDHSSSGYHKLTFNAGNLTSGIYIVHARVPEKMDEVRKVVLMK